MREFAAVKNNGRLECIGCFGQVVENLGDTAFQTPSIIPVRAPPTDKCTCCSQPINNTNSVFYLIKLTNFYKWSKS